MKIFHNLLSNSGDFVTRRAHIPVKRSHWGVRRIMRGKDIARDIRETELNNLIWSRRWQKVAVPLRVGKKEDR